MKDQLTKRKAHRYCEFSITIDTREQQPWMFQDMETLAVRWEVSASRGTLSQGDYAIEGHEYLIAIERKSLADLYSTVSQGRERFARELDRIAEHHRQGAVIVEAPWEAIYRPKQFQPNWHSNMRPQSVIGTIQSAIIRWPRIHWLCMPTRRSAEWSAFQLMRFAWEQQHNTQWEPLDDE